MHRKIRTLTIGLLAAAAILLQAKAACAQALHRLSGRTMGTEYHVTVAAPDLPEGLQERIDARLEAINAAMSTFRKESEISRFNRLAETGRPFRAGGDFLAVMTASRDLHGITGGAWDPTVDPLVTLWGFGRAKGKGPGSLPPSPEAIQKALSKVGFDHIRIREDGTLEKGISGVAVDLASIAKGYGVDRIADLLAREGLHNFLVEIGGEIYAAGRRAPDRPWRAGINTPRPEALFDEVYAAFTLENRALATSGDYRNFVVIGGRTYSHVIDPRTGYPVDNGVVSASVTAGTCTRADGLATAVMVLGPDEGIALADRLPGIECLIVVRGSDGALSDHYSKGFSGDR